VGEITAKGHACQPKEVFKDFALFFFISACEESSFQMKHAENYYIHFLTMKSTILDTHGMYLVENDQKNKNIFFSDSILSRMRMVVHGGGNNLIEVFPLIFAHFFPIPIPPFPFLINRVYPIFYLGSFFDSFGSIAGL